MTNPLLSALNEAGEAMAVIGETEPRYALHFDRGTIGVGIPSIPNRGYADTWGHADTAIEAYQIACAKRALGAAEVARKERILRRAEELEAAEEAGEHREAA